MTEATMRSYHVVLKPDSDGGYIAIVPAFPGCYSQGDTDEEAVANAQDALALTVEDMRAHGEPIPDPTDEVIGKVTESP